MDTVSKLKSFFQRFSHFTCSPVWFCAFPFCFAYFIDSSSLVYTVASIIALGLLAIEFILMLFKAYPATVFPKWMGWANAVSFWGTIITLYFLTSGDNPALSADYRSQLSAILFTVGLGGMLILVAVLGFRRMASKTAQRAAA